MPRLTSAADAKARLEFEKLYAVGDMASVPHNYMPGAFVNGGIAGADAAEYCANVDLAAHDEADLAAETKRVLAPTRRGGG